MDNLYKDDIKVESVRDKSISNYARQYVKDIIGITGIIQDGIINYIYEQEKEVDFLTLFEEFSGGLTIHQFYYLYIKPLLDSGFIENINKDENNIVNSIFVNNDDNESIESEENCNEK